MMRTRILAVPMLLVPVLAAATPVLAVPGTTDFVGPATTAWFDQTYPTATATPPPLPAGVTADDLYVAGTTVPVDGLPVPVPAPVGEAVGTLRGILALTAMAFTIPAGTSAGSLALVLTSAPSTATVGGKAPTGVTLEACPTTSGFRAGGHQPFDQVPSYDCTGQTSLSTLSADGSSVVFSDIARVARGTQLSFVIRPATTGADRLVFAEPTSRALGLLDFDSPPVFTPSGAVPVPPNLAGPVARPRTPWTQGLPPAGSLAPSPPGTSAKPVAPEVSSPSASGGLAKPAAVRVSDDSRVRLLALAGLALLLSAAGWLAFTDRRDEAADQQWGYGRYRGRRDGQAPAL
jgi:hypothetical protein